MPPFSPSTIPSMVRYVLIFCHLYLIDQPLLVAAVAWLGALFSPAFSAEGASCGSKRTIRTTSHQRILIRDHTQSTSSVHC